MAVIRWLLYTTMYVTPKLIEFHQHTPWPLTVFQGVISGAMLLIEEDERIEPDTLWKELIVSATVRERAENEFLYLTLITHLPKMVPQMMVVLSMS